MSSISKMAVACPPQYVGCAKGAARISLYADTIEELDACRPHFPETDELIIPLDLLGALSGLVAPTELKRLTVRFTETGGGWHALSAHHDYLARQETKLLIPVSLLSVQEAKVALSTGIAINVYLDTIGPEAADALNTSAQYFLHEPTVRVPMEPIGFMVKALGGQARRAKTTLWDLQRERNGRHLYISRDGQVSLSDRVLKEGLVFTTASTDCVLDVETIEESAHYQRLDSISTELFRTRSDCTTCPWFRECEGYFTTFPTFRDTGCDHWKGLFETLRGEAIALRTARQHLVSTDR